MTYFMERAGLDWSKDSVRLIATPSAVAKSTFFYVQEVGYFKTQPNYFTERKHLNSFLIVYTLSGKGYLKYKGRHYTLSAGQVFFIDCMEYQYYETDKEDLWEILWVHFNGATSRGYYELFSKNNPPVVSPGQDSRIPEILRNIIQIHNRKGITAEQQSSKLLVDILTELLFLNTAPDDSGSLIPDYIQRVMKYLDKHFNEKITLDDLAAKFSVSKFHLSKEFKRYTGFTPNEYLINTRITFAKELLQYSDLPVSRIAENVGINNTSHFINLFKNRVDTTPLTFRNRWRYSR